MRKLETIKQNSSVEALNSTHLNNTKGGLMGFYTPVLTYIPPMTDELRDKRRPPNTSSRP